MPEIKKIVLTGGPCAGKTTALVKIVEYFSGMGYKVFTVPEVPTLYSTGGWNYLTPNRQLYYQGERAILETQLALEDQFVALAEVCTKPVLVVCDRGALDISAYIKPEEWEEITAMAGMDSERLRDRRDQHVQSNRVGIAAVKEIRDRIRQRDVPLGNQSLIHREHRIRIRVNDVLDAHLQERGINQRGDIRGDRADSDRNGRLDQCLRDRADRFRLR